MKWRFIILTVFFTLLYGSLGTSLYQLQIKKSFDYIEKVQARNEILIALELRRGRILFKDRFENQIPVAINRDYPVIYAVPNEIKDPKETANFIEPIIGGNNVGQFEKILNNPKSNFKLLAERSSLDQIQQIQDLHLQGIYDGKKQYRYYAFNNLASHLLGFVGINDKNYEPTGLYGIEKKYDNLLAGGEDLLLTIDRVIQDKIEQTLKRLVNEYKATGGTIIIQEPTTGKILALADNPDFDPNVYGKYPIANFMNSAVQYVYEPGSVLKPITMAAGIDTGALSPETLFIDTGYITLNGKTIRNAGNKIYGKITMTNVIENSVNTGAIYAEQLVGNKIFYDYLKRFGFGELTDIDLPDEVRGSLKNLERKDVRAVDFATASFGQGTAITPIQLVTAFSVLANGGLLMRPFINNDFKPYIVRRVVQEETAKKVIKMMEAAVEKAGVATISGFRIAGKTGTALIPEKGKYSDQMIHTFVGFAPASNPRFTILLKLDKPSVGELAGLTVVPAFKELAQFMLNYYGIAPDNLNIESKK